MPDQFVFISENFPAVDAANQSVTVGLHLPAVVTTIIVVVFTIIIAVEDLSRLGLFLRLLLRQLA